MITTRGFFIEHTEAFLKMDELILITFDSSILTFLIWFYLDYSNSFFSFRSVLRFMLQAIDTHVEQCSKLSTDVNRSRAAKLNLSLMIVQTRLYSIVICPLVNSHALRHDLYERICIAKMFNNEYTRHVIDKRPFVSSHI